MVTILRQRNFALLWWGRLISTIGDWVLQLALPFHVYQMTGSAASTGLMFIATTLPGVLFGSIAGVFVDRWDRKKTMIIATLLLAALTSLLLPANSIQWIWVIYPVGFFASTVYQFLRPAENALLPQLVAQEHLLTANSLNALGASLAMLIGPGIGGLLMAKGGLTSVIVLDVTSFVFASGMTAFIAYSSTKPTITRTAAAHKTGIVMIATTT